ncbi:MAG: uroporphyrinogen decarboxylase [Gammaproteobacteria bacterium]|nr:uroporphyrinogen decarboxylase [Gammaproteobacteria bacterium]
MKQHRLLRALRREPVDATPIWIMRQAGRYLPEYRATRERAGSFLALCKTPELACEVALQPLRRFDLDAAILFSDILTIPDAMGMGLTIIENEGPRLERSVRSIADLNRLGDPDPEMELRYVMDAMRLIRRELHDRLPLIGFAGSPWTLATYMIEGAPGREFVHARGMLYGDPGLLHALLRKLARCIARYLQAQASAGADVLMLFDTWGGVLTPAGYREFSLHYMKEIIAGLRQARVEAPVIVFSKGASACLEDIAACGCDAVGVDWTADLGAARARIGQRVALQGNLDPCVLTAAPEVVRREAAAVLARYGAGPGHVFNLGHGIQPQADPDNVFALVEAVHDLSRAHHGCADPRASG